MIEFPELNYLKEINNKLNVVFSSNSLRSQLHAVKKLLGWDSCTLLYKRNHQDLVPVLPNLVNIKREYWLVVHENLYNLQRIKAVTSFLERY